MGTDAIHITGTGNVQLNKAFFHSETTLEEIDMHFRVRVDSVNSSGDFLYGIGKYSGIAGTMIEFGGTDSTSKILVYKLSGTTPTFITQFILPFNFTLGSNYDIRIGKRIRQLVIEVTSDDSINHFYNDSMYYPSPFFGCLWGTPFIGCESGTISVSDFSLTTPYNLSPRLSVWGDSFIEGNALSDVEQRYVSLIMDSIGHQNIAIMGRGGEASTGLDTRFPAESQWFGGSKYALLAIGVNDNNFSVWQNNTLKDLDTLKKRGIIPIIATLSPRSDRLAFIAQVNTWIRTVYDGPYIDLNKAISTTGGTHWNTGMGVPDSIHPSVAGHLAIYNRILLEAPYIFRENDVYTIDFINETTNEPIIESNKYSPFSNFSSFSLGSMANILVIPGQYTYFKDTANIPGINSLFFILAPPPRPDPPSNPSITGGVYDWTNNSSFINVPDYEFSIDSGSSWTTCFEKPISSPGTTSLILRIKATSSNFKSDILNIGDISVNTSFAEQNKITVSPNPFDDKLIIEKITEETTFIFYATDGRIVKTGVLNNYLNTINTDELNSGFYIVALSGKHLKNNFKLMKK
ncbi:MAG: GDSL-type esterase/lipase family protein [Bacteroidia bacterium]